MATSRDSSSDSVGAFVTKGIPVQMLDCEIDNKLLCTICMLLPRNPVQGFCGHRFCNDCIVPQLSRSEDSILCQGCVAENLVSEESNLSKNTIFPDAACRRELNQLPVHCCYGDCDWKGLLKDVEKHCESCLWFPLPCPICQEMIARLQLEDHVTEHKRATELRINPGDTCPFSCGQQIGSESLQSHVRDQLSTHMRSIFQRLQLVESEIRPSSEAGERHPESVMALLDQLERRLSEAESRFSSRQRGEQSRGVGLPAASGMAAAAAAAAPGVMGLDEIARELDVYEKVMQVLSGETSKLQESVNKAGEDQQQHRSKLDSLQLKVNTMERAVDQDDVRLSSMETKLADLELTSHDGTLLWKITEVGRRRREAVSGQVVSIQSPAFYTSRTGYKLFGRVYLNGDGSGKTTHVSVFIVIARGTFDALLRWPFNQRVTVTLRDQVSDTRHVVETFRPDRSTAAFQRPTSEFNSATGFPKFVSLTSIDSPQNVYVRDDTMFIGVAVDCRDL